MLSYGSSRGKDRELKAGGIYLRLEERGFSEEGKPEPNPSKSAGVLATEVGSGANANLDSREV